MGRQAIHISERYAPIGAIVLMLLCASCASDRPTEREVLKKFPQDQPPSILAERMRAKEVEKEPGQPVPAQEAMTAPPGPATPLEARAVMVTGLQVQGRGPAGATILVTADGTLTDYESFALPNPPRLVIDLPRARHAIPQPVTLPAGSPILKIRTTQYREHPVPVVRLVFDLGQPLPYRLELTGNQMQILVSEEASKEVSSMPGSKQAEPAKQDTPAAEAPKPSEPPTVVQVAPSAADGTAESTGLVAPASGVGVVEKGEAKPAEDISPAAPVEARAVMVTGLQVQGRGPAGATILVTADGTLTDYESFALPNPPRLVIDLPRARHAIPQPVTLPAGSPILKIRTTQYREHPVPVVRLVFDLEQPLPFKTDRVETGLQVSLGEVAQESVPSTMAETPKKEEAPKAQPPLQRKPPPPALARRPRPEPRPAPLRESPKMMELPPLSALPPEQPIAPAPPTMPKAPLSNNRLSLDFKGADLDDLLRLISEVSGLNMVAAHELKERKDRDITIRLTNVEWRQALDLILRAKKLSYEQDGNVIYVGLKADIQKAKEERVTEGARKKVEEEERLYAEEPKCTKLIQLAHTKASEVKKHLDPLKTRRGSVELDERTNTLIVSDVQSACLKMAAIAKELDVPPKDPFVTKLLPFNYAKAADLRTNLAALKTPQGSVVVDERSSRIIMKDLPQAVERMETFLKQIDIPTPQVLIEARIVEASRTFSQSLGVQWGGAGIPTSAGSRTGVTTFGGSGSPGGSIQFPPLTPTTPNPFPVGPNPIPFVGPVPLALSLPAISAGANPFVLGAVIGSLANRYILGLQLSAAEREGRIRTLSSPRVATQDNEEAEIKQGTQVPYTTIDSSGRTVVSFLDAFIKLKVKPHITPDGRVSMKVEAERSFAGEQINFTGGFVFPINTRKATTNIMVPNGSTVVIGGLLQSTEGISEDRVPFLGKIPILGWLFKRHSVGPEERVELLIFLTPSILQESRT